MPRPVRPPGVIQCPGALTKIQNFQFPLEQVAKLAAESAAKYYEQGQVLVADSLDLPLTDED